MHKNPSSGKRSTQPFGEEGFFGKCVGSNILKVDTLPRRVAGTHLFGEDANWLLGKMDSLGKAHFYATELSKSNFSLGRVSTLTIFLPTHFPKESIFPKGSVDLFPEEGFLCNTFLIYRILSG